MRRSRATNIAERRTSNIPLYTFVGGKGGVGKTTCAAATAILSATSGRETLVISTDPAPSLADALQQRLGSAPRAVRGVRRLHALEVDAAAALDRWLAKRRSTLEEIALRGTWLDREDVSRLLKLSLPGIDEIAALLQILEFGSHRRYERIVVDTAPTGHLLRMLAMPSLLAELANAFDHMQDRHRVMVEALRGGWTPDAADRLIEEMRADAENIGSLVRDPARAAVWWVTLPEPMSVEEAADGMRWLGENGIAVDRVIVNRSTPPPPEPCRWCRARRGIEAEALDLLRGMLDSSAPIVSVPALDREPRGPEALRAMGAWLVGGPRRFPTPSEKTAAPVTATLPTGGGNLPTAADLVPPESRLVMFGGKGGVGKTTCAAAAALRLAGVSRHRRVLLISADPAHSLGDALGQRFSDVAAPVRGGPRNLMVRELDATRVFAAFRRRFASAIADLFVRHPGTVESSLVAHDREVMRDLLDLAPPGVDELVAIIEVHDALSGEASSLYDVVVIDTAPTGHAMRLIEMPVIVHDWVKTVMSILLKYQPVVGLGDLGAVLLRLSQGLGRLREALTDSVQTRFVVVTRAAALPRAETLRLVRRLHASGVSVPVVIVNAVGSGTCSRCVAGASVETREIAALRRDLARGGRRIPQVLLTPAEIPPPHGPERLRNWQATWRGLAGEPRQGAQRASVRARRGGSDR